MGLSYLRLSSVISQPSCGVSFVLSVLFWSNECLVEEESKGIKREKQTGVRKTCNVSEPLFFMCRSSVYAPGFDLNFDHHQFYLFSNQTYLSPHASASCLTSTS